MSKPAHKIRIGVLQATIWRNSGDKGTWYSVTSSRSYKQGDDAWKETSVPQSPAPNPTLLPSLCSA